MMHKVLVFAAHPDDEIIGVGGTLYKHVKAGDTVDVVIVGGKTTSRDLQQDVSTDETKNALKILGINSYVNENIPDNRFDSINLLDIVKMVAKHVRNLTPDIVYTHHFGDLNVDHRILSEAVITACRPIENGCVEEIRMFETLSSTEMAGYETKSVFQPNMFIDISEELKLKLEALSCYKSEIRDYPHPRSLRAIEYNAYVWGVKNNLKAAEAFHLFRSVKHNV